MYLYLNRVNWMPNSRQQYFFILVSIIIFVISLQGCNTASFTNDDSNWSQAGGNPGATKYSALDQINKSNVAHLKQAWIYNSGDMRGNVQGNPVIVNGVVFVTTPGAELIALNGENGKEIWRFNPSRPGENLGGTIRGVAYWKGDNNDERIFYSAGSYLNAVNARTGKSVINFGDSGRIDLNRDLMRPPGEMRLTAPAYPVVYKNVIIVGGMTWTAPANVSGFDAITGKRKWIFNVIPHPGEEGYETWGDKNFWKNGAGVNVWGGLSVDIQNGIVFFSTGQPKDDFSRPGNEGAQLYGNSIVALNASTGKKIWHYQTLHHDLWDLDLPCAPVLADLYNNGKKIPGVVQLSKTGNVFMFNRLTGELLSKVEERPVPASSLPGEYSFPTQPYVTWPEPFARQVITGNDLTTLTPAKHEEALKIFSNSDTAWMAPPSVRGSIYYGIHGGAEWGGGSYDPGTDRIYVNANELAWHIIMRDINAQGNENKDLPISPGKKVFLKNGCVSCHGANREGMGAIPKLTGLNQKYSRLQLVEIIHSGRGAMPAFSQIPKDDIELLCDYLLDIGTGSQKINNKEKKPVYRSLGYNKFLDKDGYPATKPPYGTLNAINLKTGKIDWKVPLGEYPELTAQGIPVTGTENFGGSIVTKGGLIFIGASRDQKFRAFDKETGKILWETTLPYGGYATPSTYYVKGKQYIIIPATGGGKLGTQTGDAYVAFCLP